MSEVDDLRAEKDYFFRYTDMSPLTPEQRETFTGLGYYPEDPAYDVVAEFEPFADARPVTLITSQGDVQQFFGIGKLRFTIGLESRGGQICVFDNVGHALLGTITVMDDSAARFAPIRWLDLSPDGTRLVVNLSEGAILVYQVAP